MQRAEQVKKIIAFDKTETYSKLKKFNFDKSNSYYNGVIIDIKNKSKPEIDAIESNIISKRLYIDVIGGKLQVSSITNDYIKVLKQYLSFYPKNMINITGHTDNKGYFQNNLVKGQFKADKLREYFIESGINSNQIKTFSKGESEPIANKSTLEGKELNNRIEININ